MITEIFPSDLESVQSGVEKSGFSRLKPSGGTMPWNHLELIGLSMTNDEDWIAPPDYRKLIKEDKLKVPPNPSVSGTVSLTIGQGGIKNREIPRATKDIFRQYVFPSIRKRYPEYGENFHLTLHFKNNILIQLQISDVPV